MVRLGLSFLRDRRATSAVEFALISPFLLLLLAGILAYGSLFATSLSLQQLAAETARATIGGLNDTERKALAQAHLNANATGYPMLQADRVTFQFDEGSGTTLSKVKLTYDITAHPAWALHQLVPMPPGTLTYTLIINDGNGATS
jgi:Flp pilus assembly protein TadG